MATNVHDAHVTVGPETAVTDDALDVLHRARTAISAKSSGVKACILLAVLASGEAMYQSKTPSVKPAALENAFLRLATARDLARVRLKDASSEVRERWQNQEVEIDARLTDLVSRLAGGADEAVPFALSSLRVLERVVWKFIELGLESPSSARGAVIAPIGSAAH